MNKGLITHASIFNLAAPGANTDILSSSITLKEGGAWRVTVALTTASVFNVTYTDGTTTHALGLNSSVALLAGDLYTFAFGGSPIETSSGSTNTLSINFQVETDSVIELLIIEEVQLGTA